MEQIRIYQTKEGPSIITDSENNILYNSKFRDIKSPRTEPGRSKLAGVVSPDKPFKEIFTVEAFGPGDCVVSRYNPDLCLAECLKPETFTVKSVTEIPREQYLRLVEKSKEYQERYRRKVEELGKASGIVQLSQEYEKVNRELLQKIAQVPKPSLDELIEKLEGEQK